LKKFLLSCEGISRLRTTVTFLFEMDKA